MNGIYVQGKTLDQVTDMMVANAHNLIITGWCAYVSIGSCIALERFSCGMPSVKPANQRNTLQRSTSGRSAVPAVDVDTESDGGTDSSR